MRLGVDEVGVTELMAVTEHTQCLSVVAASLLLEGLDDEPRLVAPLDPAAADGDVRTLLDDIRRALAPGPGLERIPALWRVLARNRHYLESTWRKEQVVMGPGTLAPRDKRRVALGIAMNARSRYMIEYNLALLRRAGDTDDDVLEILGVVDHYNCLNTLSDGMQLPSDIHPPA
jgi:alkylhydroperoxidase/carboxymuconolactone decarboxylase family protein YurZ